METIALLIFVYMTAWFVISVILKRNDVADVAWGLGFVVSAWILYLMNSVGNTRASIVLVLVTIWGLRLTYHIFMRNIKKSEDSRYATWRIEWKKYFYVRSYLQVFILQGVLMFLILIPVSLVNINATSGINALDVVGIFVWILGFYFESVGDSELKKFLSNPDNKGGILNTGLWKYTRHPNYFGEVAQWWGVWIITLSVPYGYVAILGPLTITFLILKVSGVPLLERKMSQNPLFDQYIRSTSKFIPLPRRK